MDMKLPAYTPEALKRLKDATDQHNALVEKLKNEKSGWALLDESQRALHDLIAKEYVNATKEA